MKSKPINNKIFYYITFAIIAFFFAFVFFNYQFENKTSENRNVNGTYEPRASELKVSPNAKPSSNPNVKQKEKVQGFIAAKYSHELFSKMIKDITVINVQNTLVRNISDNVNEFDYINADFYKDSAAILFASQGDKNKKLAVVPVKGMSIKTAYNYKDPIELGDLKVESISLSPDKSKVLLGVADDKDKIILIDLKDKSKKDITNGRQARWVSDDKFIYLSDEGVSLYSLKESKSKALLTLNAKLSKARLIISENFSRVALYVPEYEKLSIFNFKKSTLEDLTTIDEKLTSFDLSPDGKYVAVHRILPSGTENLNQILVFSLAKDSAQKLDLELSNPRIFDFAKSDDFEVLDWY